MRGIKIRYMYYLPYNLNLKENARKLRNNSTLSEVLLWNKLKGRQLKGYQFNRQKPLDQYIVDFYCKALNMVIEIDGLYHEHPLVRLNDIERQERLEAMGLRFIRFENYEVERNIGVVLDAIIKFIEKLEREANSPAPFKKGGDESPYPL